MFTIISCNYLKISKKSVERIMNSTQIVRNFSSFSQFCIKLSKHHLTFVYHIFKNKSRVAKQISATSRSLSPLISLGHNSNYRVVSNGFEPWSNSL